MTIVEVIVVRERRGMDKVSLETDLPCPYADESLGCLHLHFEVERGKGVEYVKENFDVDPGCITLIDVSKM